MIEQGSLISKNASANLAFRAKDSFVLQDAEMRLGMLLNDTAMPTKEKVKQMNILQDLINKLRGIDAGAIKKVPKHNV